MKETEEVLKAAMVVLEYYRKLAFNQLELEKDYNTYYGRDSGDVLESLIKIRDLVATLKAQVSYEKHVDSGGMIRL